MEGLLIIKRGYIYEFTPKTIGFTGKAYALAVSANNRGADNIVNIIMLSTTYIPESIPITNDTFPENILYCNCGKVTHTERMRLVKEIGKVSDKKMERIDNQISATLGLYPQELEVENRIYKDMYHNLLEKVVQNNG